MDPVGPWYASYNRLTSGNCANSAFQSSTTNIGNDFVTHHLASAVTQAVPSTTTSQLLLQAAHTTATLAGQPSPFNPGGFLSPPPVGYDVFSPLFHHTNPKQAHYVTQHRPVLTHQTPALSTKQNSPTEPDISPIRENYSSAHQSTFFEQQTSATSPTASTLAWTHQNNSQLPSPFGILPHESVVPASPGTPSTKTTGATYENTFNAHFANAQPINNINSQDFKSSNKGTSVVRSHSPIALKSASNAASGNNQTFFQQVPNNFNSDTIANDYTTSSQTSNGKVSGSMHQQSCIVSTTNNTTTKDYRAPQTLSRPATASTIFLNTSVNRSEKSPQNRGTNFASPPNKPTSSTQQVVQTKAQAKIYPELINHNEHRRPEGHESSSSQSSPISFSAMDSRTLNYAANNNNCNSTTGKHANNPRTPTNGNLQHNQQQQSQQPFHVLTQPQQITAYRHYSTGSASDSEYHHPSRSKSATSTDSAYSSNTSTQNGPDCSVVVPRRPSPLQAQSQVSPLGHVPSPAYPIYNSPMATMSSPSPLQQHNDSNGNQCTTSTYKTSVQQQVTPPSPLDVTVPRPASQGHGQVAYSSVITRALVTTESNKTTYSAENRNYERQMEFSPKQPVCWETDNRQNRKFPVTTYAAASTDMNQVPSLPPQQQQQPVQRIIGVAERQQTYFDSSQVTLQDLSSCRGDPMSIVKNLQQQDTCQMQQQSATGTLSTESVQQKAEDRRKTVENINKKRKSMEKMTHGSSVNDLTCTTTMTDYLGRIPPPAHHNVNQQPQQNGYLEFERWNLAGPPPTTKIFPSSTGAFGSQSSLHHSSNFAGNPAHQQTLMVSHHHASSTMPYFPPFHIPTGHHPHHPHEFQSSVDIAPIGFTENSNQQNSNFSQEAKDESHLKVVVPNIEEELGFLRQSQPPIQITNKMNKDMNHKDPNSGFMASYVKFLQGEREPSPPPAMRGGRKATWNRSKPYIAPEPSKSLEISNGIAAQKTQDQKAQQKDVQTIDYANDPRYFPLPKERKKNFDSSDDGFTSDDDFPFSLKKPEKKSNNNTANNNTNNRADNMQVKRENKPKKGRPIKPGGPTDRKRKAAAAAAAAAVVAAGPDNGKTHRKTGGGIATTLPRRETSRRKAKEKSSVKKLLDQQQGIDYFDNDEEQEDSDSDPAWTPAAKLTGDEEEKRRKRARPIINRRTKKLLDEDGYSSGDSGIPSKVKRKKNETSSKNVTNSTKVTCKIDENLLANTVNKAIDIAPFKPGDFVIIKTDLGKEYPPLWRIDGRTLLQKYEPFETNGKTLYRNISTYSGWPPETRHNYQPVPVKYWQQEKLEIIVEFLRDEIIMSDRKCIEESMRNTEKYQDNFEVYIQTLISQALDSNFLTEIFQEQDDYFLSNVKTVDDVTEEKKQGLLSTTKWSANFITAMSIWPCINVLKELPQSEIKGKACAGCQQVKIHARILLYGQPYNSTTLEGSPPDPKVPQNKDFLLCRMCQAKVALYNRVAHQKYLMFLECARRVGEKRVTDSKKDTTIILNELLADETWLNQLFKDVRSIWAEIDSMQNQANNKSNDSSSASINEVKKEADKNSKSNSQVGEFTDVQIENCNDKEVTGC